MSCLKETISSKQPCAVCGKPDYCFRLRFDNGGILHCCARVDEPAVFHGGIEFMAVKTKDTDIGTYTYYQDKASYEAWRTQFGKSQGKREFKQSTPTKIIQTDTNQKKLEGEDEVAPDSRLDQVYRKFLSLLVLERKDEELLRKEWDQPSTGQLFDRLVQCYPIKSLAPQDYIRKRCNYKDGYQNKPRYLICKQLVTEVGEPVGVPGFFKNDYGWSYSGTSGILFPIYNAKGEIIRLRLRESYPEIKGTFKNIEGIFRMSYEEEGQMQWHFTSNEESSKGKKILVYGSKVKLIELKEDGCPKGKAASKYKNFTSVFEKLLEDGTIVNGYGTHGARSGSNISLYCKEGDDFSVVYITEGEKKAMVANMLLGVPVISLPGTGTFSKLFEKDVNGVSIMDILIERGMKLCVIAYDADKNTNIQVVKSEKKAILEFLKRGIKIAIGEWNPAFGKGLDDILVAGIRPSVYLCQ